MRERVDFTGSLLPWRCRFELSTLQGIMTIQQSTFAGFRINPQLILTRHNSSNHVPFGQGAGNFLFVPNLLKKTFKNTSIPLKIRSFTRPHVWIDTPMYVTSRYCANSLHRRCTYTGQKNVKHFPHSICKMLTLSSSSLAAT